MHEVRFYGHSWIDGDGASDPVSTLVALTGQELGLPVVNCGVGGSLSTGTAELVNVDPPAPADVFVLMTGLNDARLYGELEAARQRYAAALQTVFSAFRRANPDAVVVAVEQPPLQDYSRHAPHHLGSDAIVTAYNTLLAVAAAENGAFLATVLDWDGSTMFAEDAVHPNDAGHVALARAVVRTVRHAGGP